MRDALAHLADRDRFFEAPEVLPQRPPGVPDACRGRRLLPDGRRARLEAVNAWLERRRRRGRVPASTAGPCSATTPFYLDDVVRHDGRRSGVPATAPSP